MFIVQAGTRGDPPVVAVDAEAGGAEVTLVTPAGRGDPGRLHHSRQVLGTARALQEGEQQGSVSWSPALSRLYRSSNNIGLSRVSGVLLHTDANSRRHTAVMDC